MRWREIIIYLYLLLLKFLKKIIIIITDKVKVYPHELFLPKLDESKVLNFLKDIITKE